MPNVGNRMGWNDEIDTFAKTFMSQMGKVVCEWCTNIINRKGKILDGIDEQIQNAKEEIALKQAMVKTMKAKIELLENAASKALAEWQRLVNDEAGHYKTTANKYIIEKENLKTLKKNSKAYQNQTARLKQFEPKYLKWIEITQNAEKRLAEYQDLTKELAAVRKKEKGLWINDRQSLSHYIEVSLKKDLKFLEESKVLLEGAIATNMSQHRQELVNAFSNPRYIDAISGMIANAIDKVLQGSLHFNEFSEDNIYQFLEEIFAEVSPDKLERFNFLRTLAADKKNYSVIENGDKTIKVFDMDHITVDDMMRALSGWFQKSILITVQNVLKKMKRKRQLFIPEQQKPEDDDDNSLYNTRPSEDEVIPDDNKKKKYQRGHCDEDLINHGAREYWRALEAFLVRNIDAVAETVNDALQRQLPNNAYFKRIGTARVKTELRGVMEKVISACSREIHNGKAASPKTLRNFIKSAIGGSEDGEIFNMIYTIIRAALEYYIVSYMGRNILEDVKDIQHNEAVQELALLRTLDKKKGISERALLHYTMATCNAPAIMNSEGRNFEDPEDMLQRLMGASYQTENKIDFF